MASFLGIDLSKETFHASLLSDRGEAKKVFPNTPKGFKQLAAWLENRGAADVHVCMEATGAYWEALALHLHGLEKRVSVVNPARIKAFAQSELLRTKTDAVNAALIARFCKSQSPQPWIPPPLPTAGNPCFTGAYAPLRASQNDPSSAVGLCTVVRGGCHRSLDTRSYRHPRRANRSRGAGDPAAFRRPSRSSPEARSLDLDPWNRRDDCRNIACRDSKYRPL